MLYFLILPIYLIFLAVTICAVSISRPYMKNLSSYGAGAAIGSIPGFIIANILLWVVTVLLIQFHLPEWMQTVQKICIASLAIIGPLPVSVIGIISGSFVGTCIVYRRIKLHERFFKIDNQSNKIQKKQDR